MHWHYVFMFFFCNSLSHSISPACTIRSSVRGARSTHFSCTRYCPIRLCIHTQKHAVGCHTHTRFAGVHRVDQQYIAEICVWQMRVCVRRVHQTPPASYITPRDTVCDRMRAKALAFAAAERRCGCRKRSRRRSFQATAINNNENAACSLYARIMRGNLCTNSMLQQPLNIQHDTHSSVPQSPAKHCAEHRCALSQCSPTFRLPQCRSPMAI